MACASTVGSAYAYLKLFAVEVNGQLQLIEPGHTVGAHEKRLTKDDDGRNIEAVRDAEHADYVGVCEAISCYSAGTQDRENSREG